LRFRCGVLRENDSNRVVIEQNASSVGLVGVDLAFHELKPIPRIASWRLPGVVGKTIELRVKV